MRQAISYCPPGDRPCLNGFFSWVLVAFLIISPLPAKVPVVKFAEAIEKGDLKTVRKMLADGLDPNTRIPEDSLDYTPLFLSVQSTNPKITEALLKAGADPTLEDGNSDPVMVHAADVGQEAHARLLIKHGHSIDAKNSDGLTALMRGATYEKGPDIQVKIDLGANLNLTDVDGKTALMRAAGAVNLEAMKVLIKAGAKLDVANESGESALTLALRGRRVYSNAPEDNSSIAATRLLLEAGANINQRLANGKSVLIFALDSWEVSQEIIEALLAAKPDVTIRDEDGRDALYYAVLYKRLENHIAPLLELGADPKKTDNEGTTLLMRAAGNFQIDLVRDLISRGLSASDQNLAGQTAIHFASGAGRYGSDNLSTEAKGKKILSVLELLRKNKASLISPDKAGNTPLHLATITGIPAVISFLLPHYSNVEIQNAKGETPLHLAAMHGKGKVIELLFPKCKEIDRRDARGYTALMHAVAIDHQWSVLYLLEAGADLEAKDRNGISSLSAAVAANEIDRIKFLLEIDADPKSLEKPDSELLRAARLFHDEITSPGDYAYLVDLLAGLATNINHRDAEGRTALMWVAASRNKAALKTHIDRKAKLDARSSDGRTALMWAACSQATNSMKTLIKAGANESLKGPTGRTAGDWLKWSKATHQPTKPPQSEGDISLGERIVRSRKIALQEYLKKGTVKNNDRVAGMPPLHLAAALGDTAAITTLIQFGASKNFSMSGGSTPLMEAAANGHPKAVELLLKNGANPKAKTLNGLTPLDLARKYQAKEAIDLLESASK